MRLLLDKAFRNSVIMRKLVFVIVVWICFFNAKGQEVFNLTGDAYTVGGNPKTINLIDGVNETGGAWLKDTFDLNSGFFIDFTVDFGDFNSQGFAFVLQNSSVAPVGGTDSLLGVPTSGNSFIIEFDFYQNGGQTDAQAPHISLFKDGVLMHQSANSIYDVLFSPPLNQVETLRFSYNGLSDVITVSRDSCSSTLFSYTYDITNNVFGGNGEVLAGFTAASGLTTVGIPVQVRYDYSSQEKLEGKSVCLGDTLLISSFNNPVDFWSFAETISYTNEGVFAQPTQSGYVNLSHEGVCGTYKDSFFVTVFPKVTIDTIVNFNPDYTANIDVTISGGLVPYTSNWTFPDNSQINQEDLTSVTSGSYQLAVVDGNNCTQTTQVQIVVPEKGSQDFFTPDGDGLNETIEINVEGASKLVNQAGQIIKEVYFGEIWDGTNQNGELMPSGVYLVIGQNGVQTITLLR